MGNGLSPLGPIGNKVLYNADGVRPGSGGQSNTELEGQITLVLHDPNSRETLLLGNDSFYAGYAIGMNETILTSPQLDKIIDCVLQDPDSDLAAGVGLNKAIVNFPRIDEIIGCVLQPQNLCSRLADAIGSNETIINSPRINEMFDCALQYPGSSLAYAIVCNEVIRNSPLYVNKINRLKELQKALPADEIESSGLIVLS